VPLFPKIPKPVNSDGSEDPKASSSGYQWIFDKFVQLAADIAAIREQTVQDEDEAEYRKHVLTINLAAGKTTGSASLPAVPPGVEYRIERVLAAGAAGSLDVFTHSSATSDVLFGNLALLKKSSVGLVGEKELSPYVVLRAGEELTVVALEGTEATQVKVTVWLRVVAEKPQGLAVG
jgi:hypothetical protein